MKWLKAIKRKFRERRIERECGCICSCPICRNALNDQKMTCAENGQVTYECMQCGTHSTWTFDAAPVPILLKYYTTFV